MPRKKYIRLFFCCLLAALLLVVFAGGRSFVPVQQVTKEVAAASAEKGDKELPGSKTIVSELSLNAVVLSAFAFDFSQYYLLFPACILIPLRFSLAAPRFSIPYFFFSYFNKIFGNFIVANAP